VGKGPLAQARFIAQASEKVGTSGAGAPIAQASEEVGADTRTDRTCARNAAGVPYSKGLTMPTNAGRIPDDHRDGIPSAYRGDQTGLDADGICQTIAQQVKSGHVFWNQDKTFTLSPKGEARKKIDGGTDVPAFISDANDLAEAGTPINPNVNLDPGVDPCQV
jgi:hypothetical protein